MVFRINTEWKAGDIAFLRNLNEWPSEDLRLVGNDRRLQIHPGATGHPVIILHLNDRQAIITTVSAYRSGAWNNNLAPWKTQVHRRKAQYDFRAFQGSELPSRQPALKLADGAFMPKLETSWVYTRFTTIVPIGALVNFDKSHDLLRMAPESLSDLLAHVTRASMNFAAQKMILEKAAPTKRATITVRFQPERPKTQPKTQPISGNGRTKPAMPTAMTYAQMARPTSGPSCDWRRI